MRILLVDDDTSIVQALLPVLRSLPGHEVRAATSGEEAVETISALGGMDLLITDVVMDPFDGFALSEQLRAQYPAMRTIFITGYDLSDYADRIGSTQLLQKPITIDALSAAVENEVAAARAAAAVPVVARPTVVARAGAIPTAAGQPRAAVPKAVPAIKQPAVVPKAQVATAVKPVAGPKAVPAARAVAPKTVAPGAQPRAVAPATAADLSAPSPVAPSSEDASAPPPLGADGAASNHETSAGLIGQLIGGYQIVSQLGEERFGTLYAAVQTAINRPVGLKVLDPACARDDAQRQRFIADARAKAHVQHPSILSVYEAGAADGWIYYTHEYVDGQNLVEMYTSGRRVDEITALKILKTTAEGLLYLGKNDVPHATFQGSDIYLGTDGHSRLANLATQFADEQLTTGQEIEVLGQAVWAVLAQPVSEGLRNLLARTQQASPGAITGWGALLQGIKALEPKIVPVEAEKISAQERAAAAAAEKARMAQRRSLYMNAGFMGLFVVFVAWVVWYNLRSNERLLNDQVHIPAGPFLMGVGQPANAPEYWIDKYEVTIGQYAKFVDWLKANPKDEHAYDHPRQPRQLSHIPDDWLIYYGRAAAGKPVHKTPISLNSPIFTVDWWDAYAYARWRGRELPTEAEWERAGRGTDGRAYPWGEEPDFKRANTNADYHEKDPGAPGEVDGYNLWSDVDALTSDKSPDGVIGMAGNVSEWTSTWTPDNMKPILKGGNFTLPLTKLSDRQPTEPGKKAEFIGFRTVSHKPPEK
jgi:formylglycine-generating enzyme required for sulfatase activity/CheY-like chemotaxis protein